MASNGPSRRPCARAGNEEPRAAVKDGLPFTATAVVRWRTARLRQPRSTATPKPVGSVGGAPEVAVTPNELMKRLSALRRAQIGGKRAPHKPLLLLWLFGRFAA